jgi:hypothetical protein
MLGVLGLARDIGEIILGNHRKTSGRDRAGLDHLHEAEMRRRSQNVDRRKYALK